MSYKVKIEQCTTGAYGVAYRNWFIVFRWAKTCGWVMISAHKNYSAAVSVRELARNGAKSTEIHNYLASLDPSATGILIGVSGDC